MNKTIIFDIDGTLANCNHRRHFVEGKKKDFDSFYACMGVDTPDKEVINLSRLYYADNWNIIICTGRPESYRKITEEWLNSYDVAYDRLYMRSEDMKYDPDYAVKQLMLKEIQKEHQVYIAVDDRQQVVDMWRRNGILCFQVADGNF